MTTVSLDLANQVLLGFASVAVPAAFSFLCGYAALKLKTAMPQLSRFLASQGVANGVEALSNAVVADMAGHLPASVNVSSAVAVRVNTISASLAADMAAHGTTPEQLSARVTGSVLTKLTPPTV
jgi:hypothetical protein